MGKTTESTLTRFQQAFSQKPAENIKCMSGAVAVWDPHQNRFFNVFKSVGNTGHVEQDLIASVKQQFGPNLQNLFNSAKLVFFCPWSPCINCTNNVIPDFMNLVTSLNRDIRVRFRFTYYYAAGVADTQHNYRWDSVAAAQNAYTACMEQFGQRSSVSLEPEHDTIPGEYPGTEHAVVVERDLVKYYLTIMSLTDSRVPNKKSGVIEKFGHVL